MQDVILNELANLNKKVDRMTRQLDFYFGKYFTTKAEEDKKEFIDSMSTDEAMMFLKASNII